MTPAERLLIELRTMNIRVRMDGDLVRCKAPEGVAISTDLAGQIRTLKPELLALLREEAAAIAWRVESGLALEAPMNHPIGACLYCGARMPGQQTGKCVLCCLAAAQILEQRWQKERATYPNAPIIVEHGQMATRAGEVVRDMSPVGKAAA
jgi:hypothetical protein